MNYASSDSPSSCGFQDGNSRCTGTTTSWDSGIGGLSATTTFGTQLEGEDFQIQISFLNGVNFLLNAPHAVFGVE